MGTRWTPDTCACSIEYDENINVLNVFNTCPKHAGKTPANQLAAVLAHNRKKNNVFSDLVDRVRNKATALDRAIPTVIGDDGQPVPVVRLQYDPNAPEGNDPLQLLLVASAFTAAQATQLQSALDAKFGAGVVSVTRV